MWLGGTGYTAADSPLLAAAEPGLADQPLATSTPTEASPDSVPPALEVERSEPVAASPTSPGPQSLPRAYPTDSASMGFHPVSRVDDAFPLFFGAVFILILGSVVIKLASLARRNTDNEGYENVFELATTSPRFAKPAVVPAITAPRSSTIPFDDPLRLTIGDTFTLDLPEYAGHQLMVERIEQYTTRVGGQRFGYAAYWARNQADGSDARLQLRVERESEGGLAILALHIHDELDYSQELYNIVETDRTGLFQITDDNTGQVTAEYRRPEGVLRAYDATVATPYAPAQAARHLQYWDYSRQLDTPQGAVAEYLIVEMETSGHFRILLGPQIDSAAITPTTKL